MNFTCPMCIYTFSYVSPKHKSCSSKANIQLTPELSGGKALSCCQHGCFSAKVNDVCQGTGQDPPTHIESFSLKWHLFFGISNTYAWGVTFYWEILKVSLPKKLYFTLLCLNLYFCIGDIHFSSKTQTLKYIALINSIQGT